MTDNDKKIVSFPAKISQRMLNAVLIHISDPTKTKAQVLREAGYSEGTAQKPSQVWNHPLFVEVLEAKQGEMARRTDGMGITAEWITEKVREIADDPKVPKANRVSALEMLGKFKGMFRNRVDIGAEDALVAKLHAGRDRNAATPDDQED